MQIPFKKISVFLVLTGGVILFLFILFDSFFSDRETVSSSTHNTLFLGGVYDKKVGLNPYFILDGDNIQMVQFLYSTLVKLDEKGQVIGDVAEDWSVAPDFKSITFRLRKDVYFHDKTPLTSKDIKWTWEKMIRSSDNVFFQCYSFIDSSETPDPYTISFYFNRATPSPQYYFIFEILPSHVNADSRTSDFSSTPVGSGAYVFDHWDDSVCYYRKNLVYYEKTPRLEFIRFISYPNNDAVWSGFMREEIDFFLRLNHDQYNMISRSDEFIIKEAKSLRYFLLLLNKNQVFLKNKRVRQAIDLCINRVELVEKIFYGKARIISGPYDEDFLYVVGGREKASYQPEKAISMLKSCGFEDSNHDSILEKQNQPFILRLLINENMTDSLEIAKLIKLQLKQAGIFVKIISISNAEEYAGALSRDMDFDMIIDYKPLNLEELALIYWVKDIGRKPYLLEKQSLFTRMYWKMLRTKNKNIKRYYYQSLLKIIANEKTSLFLVNPLEMLAFQKGLDLSGTSFAPQFQYENLGKIQKEART
ncbi:MAG: hypothetical protein JW774_05690 [Candidatus Aureabacteria bacterium]|nr:hypothetical protein [Candidatus Auribacterota bacterium]